MKSVFMSVFMIDPMSPSGNVGTMDKETVV